jgi:hypothetical protein
MRIGKERKGAKSQAFSQSIRAHTFFPFLLLLLGYTDKQVTRQIWEQTLLPDK